MLFGYDTAKEFGQIAHWLNSEPLLMQDLKGKVILLDFFAYSCINCRRAIEHVKKMHEKYKSKGLVVIGVHAPEFEFEKVPQNLQKTLDTISVRYPVAMDNEHTTWYLYGGQYWPRQAVIDGQQRILLNVTGESHGKEVETAIRKALQEKGLDVTQIPLEEEEPSPLRLRQTPEIYASFFRNEGIGSTHIESQDLYEDKNEEHKEGVLYPQGYWKQNYEYLHHLKAGSEEDWVLLPLHAQEVNIVAMPYNTGEKAKVYVELDSMPVPKEKAGKDILYEGKRSYILVDRPELYRLIAMKERGTHELKLLTASQEFCLLSFTFG